MRTLISIFALPEEIDDLERTLIQLKQASKYLDNTDQVLIDVSLGLSDYLTDWNKSILPKKFFHSKFIQLKEYTNWCAESNFNISEEILGCVSQRRISSKKYEVDNIIWLDTDIIFSPATLIYTLNSAKSLSDRGINKYVITPEIVRIWDGTWDCLVNENFIDKEYGYERKNDPYIDATIYGDVSLEEVNSKLINQPALKFAGGWFTCLSKEILNAIPVPESFGHYGLEDTYITWADMPYSTINQFKLKNIVVCEDYKYRNKDHYLEVISKINRKDEFLSKARQNFQIELDKIWGNVPK
jgi:hypothetical protein